jgi:DNA-binding response OmpR family regulator
MKILICEDNPLALKTLAVVLDREGFESHTAFNGNEALALLQKNDYDFLILDIHFPYYSGLELLKYVRSELGKNTPALILTAFSDPQMQSQAKELGIEGYIVKPFSPADLVSKIRSVLNK